MSLGDLDLGDGAAGIELPGDDLQPAVEMLDRRAAALHPVAAIDVARRRKIADRGMMNVTADHALRMSSRRLGGERLLEALDVVEHVLDLEFRPLRQRPTRQAQP